MSTIVLPEGIERTLRKWYSPDSYRQGGTVAYAHPSKALFCVASVPWNSAADFERLHTKIHKNPELALLPTVVGNIDIDRTFINQTRELLRNLSELSHRLEMPDFLAVTPVRTTSFRFDDFGGVKYNYIIVTTDDVARTQIPDRLRSMTYDCLL